MPRGLVIAGLAVGDFRLLLLAAAAAWAGHTLLWARAARLWAPLFAFSAAFGWSARLARPYAYGLEAEATLGLARLRLASSLGDPSATLVAGLSAEPTAVSRLLAAGFPFEVVLFAWRHAPALALLALVLLPLGLLPRRRAPETTAVLLAAFAWSDLDLAHGAALGALAWSAPGSARAALAALAVSLAAEGASRARVRVPLLVVAAGVLTRGGASPAALPDPLPGRLFDLLGSCLPLAAIAILLARRLPPGALLGAAAVAVAGPFDPAAGAVLCRAALLAGLAPSAERLASWVSERLASRGAEAGTPARAGALLVLATIPFGAVFWWRPTGLDPLYERSLGPLPRTFVEAGRAVAENVPPGSTVLTSANLAPVVGLAAGRRVLRAPGLETAPDEYRRIAVEIMALEGTAGAAELDGYGLTHILAPPWGFGPARPRPDVLGSRPGYTLVRETAGGVRLYRVEAAARGASR